MLTPRTLIAVVTLAAVTAVAAVVLSHVSEQSQETVAAMEVRMVTATLLTHIEEAETVADYLADAAPVELAAAIRAGHGALELRPTAAVLVGVAETVQAETLRAAAVVGWAEAERVAARVAAVGIDQVLIEDYETWGVTVIVDTDSVCPASSDACVSNGHRGSVLMAEGRTMTPYLLAHELTHVATDYSTYGIGTRVDVQASFNGQTHTFASGLHDLTQARGEQLTDAMAWQRYGTKHLAARGYLHSALVTDAQWEAAAATWGLILIERAR